jgi:hypothetical protein
MDIRNLPAGIPTPDAVRKAQAALDALWDRYGDAQLEYVDALGDGWQERAHARDAAAARAAVLAGKPLPTGETEIARVTALRGTAVGVVEALEAQIRAADAAVSRAWASVLPEVRGEVVAALKAAEQDYADTWNRFVKARGAVRSAVSALAAVDHAERGRSGNPPVFRSTPTADQTVVQLGRDWLASKSISVDPGDIVKVRVAAMGGVKLTRELPADVAESLISAGAAERVEPEAAP